jgi:hypothetical protein
MPDDQSDRIMAKIQEIHEEIHTKVDIHDVTVVNKEQVITFERQINEDLHDALKGYDELLIELKASILDGTVHDQSKTDYLIQRINSQYGTRIKEHSRTHLCDLQAANEVGGKDS